MDVNPVRAALSGGELPRSIQIHADNVKDHPAMKNWDAADIAQHMAVTVLEQAEKYDPNRASVDTFIDRVACNAGKMLIRSNKALKRTGAWLTVSLDTPRDESGCRDLAHMLSPDADLRRPCTDIENWRLLASIREGVDTLPPEYLDVVRCLLAGKSFLSTARELGWSRRAVDRVVQDIKARLDPYAENE